MTATVSRLGAGFDEAPLTLVRRRWPVGLPLLLLVAFVGLPWLGNDYWLNAILIPFLVLSLAGLGLNLLTGYTGQTSVGAAGFMAVGAFATYGLLLRVPGLPLPLALIGGGLIAGLVGLLFGIPSSRIKGFYLMVTTLAAQFFLEWVFAKFPWFYNHASSGTISAPRLELFGHSLASPVGRYLLTLSCVVLLTWVAVNLVRSQVGRNWMAIRDMDTAASVIGIPVERYKRLAFAVSSFYLGIAGALLGLRLPGHVQCRQLRYQPLVPDPLHHHHRWHGQHRRQFHRRGFHQPHTDSAQPCRAVAVRRQRRCRAIAEPAEDPLRQPDHLVPDQGAGRPGTPARRPARTHQGLAAAILSTTASFHEP